MKPACERNFTAPDTAARLTSRSAESSAAVRVPSSAVSKATKTRAGMRGKPDSAITSANRSTKRWTASDLCAAPLAGLRRVFTGQHLHFSSFREKYKLHD